MAINKREPRLPNEVGSTALKHTGGYLYEEAHLKLQGDRAKRIYQEMADGDATVGAVLKAISLIIRAVDWKVEPASDKSSSKADAEFVQSLLDDMSHSWSDFIAEALTMLVFGWSYFEIVWKRRLGEDDNPSRKSKYKDGRIGVRKLAPRPQESLDRWELQEDGGIAGLWQTPVTGPSVFIPIQQALLLRTVSNKNNPEGKSILRSAYRAWYKMNYIEDYEAIGIERELTGLPVVRIPLDYLTSEDPVKVAIKNEYIKVARDLKLNNQAGVVIPSDTFENQDGTLSSTPLVDVKLLSSGGQRTIDTDKVINRYQRNIARSCLADFLMVGEGSSARGSYAMYIGKEGLFLRACEAILNQIADPLNRFLLPRLWALNGLNQKNIPVLLPGQIAPEDLEELGQYISDLASAGVPLFPDEKLENRLRTVGSLPEKGPGLPKPTQPNPDMGPEQKKT